MNLIHFKKILSPLVPYITVGLGLLVFHNAWAAILSYHIVMLAVIFLSDGGIDTRKFFKSKNRWIPVIAGILGIGSGILLYFLWDSLGIPDNIKVYVQSIGLTGYSWLAFIIYYSLLNPLIEEYYWRFHLCSDTGKPTLNDLLFAGYHLLVLGGHIQVFWLIVIFIILIIGAWGWRQMNRLNGGLLTSIVSHVTADISIILTIYLFTAK